ncbi:hypothetical protein ACWAT4_24170 [Bradyrhizobium manausense]
MTNDDSFTCMHDVLDALEAAIAASKADKRTALAKTIDGYAESFPEDFHWAMGAQSPSLLQHLVMVIDWSCRHDAEAKPRPGAIRLVDRTPQGNA